MDAQRRKFVNGAVATGIVAWALPKVPAANWPQSAFDKTQLDQALREITGGQQLIQDKVTLTAPKIAENGAQVRVVVKVDADDVEWISILVEKNPVPLTSKFVITESGNPHIATNVKVRETSDVIAVAKAGGKLYSGRQTVKVTAGGCA